MIVSPVKEKRAFERSNLGLVINTFLPRESVKDLKEFERLRELFLSEDLIGTQELYSAKNYNAEKALAISLAYVDGIPYGASSLLMRDGFPDSSARCVNRFFVLKDFRFGGAHYALLKENSMGLPRNPVVSVKMAEQQIKVAQNNGIDFCFFSREIPNRKWCESLNKELNLKSKLPWTLKENVVAVCNPLKFSCWQHIVFCDLKNKNRVLKFANENPENEIVEKFKN